MQDDDEQIDEIKSKTQIKKEMLALQDLGEELAALSEERLEQLPLDENLKKALLESKSISHHSAKKRHMQYIGKLMRKADHAAIHQAYDQIKQKQHQATRMHHLIESWRDDLIDNKENSLQDFINQFPNCDIQQLRQLVRAAQKEKSQKKAPANARKLFKFIRDTLL